ncbi:MAG TPA: NADPH:quinone oxidoreductase family protein [Xanthobacteraceae bacterium]|nr:NADPH:quinone oxidoreductase family protein [Xanthobacteraceae bacterium]
MRAVIVREFGPLETAAAIGDFPTPAPGPQDVLLEIHATAANFVDLLVIGGKYQFLPERPFVPGKLPAGVVAEVGAAVTTLEPGDRVLAMAEQGGYGEFVAVPAAQCFRLPDRMSFVDAAAMALAFDTAWFALRDRARLQPGDTVLVLGATGGVGLAAVQLAKTMGAKVLAGVSSKGKATIAHAAGADAVIDLSLPDLREGLRAQVYAITDNRGADIVLDPLGGDIFDAALRAVAWRGRVVVIGFAAGRIPTIKANYLLLKNIEMSGLQISDYRKRMPERMAACFKEIFALYEAGKVKPGPTTVVPIDKFASALADIRDRRARGRIVLSQGKD